jgi:hypothetical protein
MRRQQSKAREIPVLDKVNQNLIDQLAADGATPVYTLAPDEARNVLLQAQSGSVRKPDAQVKDFIVNLGGFALRFHATRPLFRIVEGRS